MADTEAGAAAGLAASSAIGSGGPIAAAGLTRLRSGAEAENDDGDGEAVPAAPAPAPTPALVASPASDAGAAADDSSPWPDDAAESVFLGEQRSAGAEATAGVLAHAPARERAAEEEERVVLPPLQTLVDRLSPGARDVLEDLFRAKFVAVRQVPRSVLK